MNLPWLSILIAVPFLTGLALLFNAGLRRNARSVSLGVSLLVLACTLGMAGAFHPGAGFQYVERYDWLTAIGFQYHLALDGISLVFVLLTAFICVMAVIASGNSLEADGRYYGLILLLESGLLGTFTAGNFLHFFLFWEFSLIPAFFLVKLYGGPHRSDAALQFFLYTMVGSIGMLLAFLALGLSSGTLAFAELPGKLYALPKPIAFGGLEPTTVSAILFFLAFAGVAVKVPIWPLHSWVPLTYTEAPTPVTMLLTGVMSKMGVYGLIRVILPNFPREMERFHQPLLALAVITILYGALAALGQRDIKRLFAYSSLSHLGYCFLGIFAAAKAAAPGLENERAAAINGVLLQALSHGFLAAALFGFVAFLERRSGGLRTLDQFGGLRKVTPGLAGLMGIVLFASLGLPGLSGFPAEFLIFKGAFSFAPVAAACAVLGLLFTALYLLTFFDKVFLGPLNEKRLQTAELTSLEKSVVVPAIVLTFALGLAPQIAIYFFNPAVAEMIKQLRF